MAFIFDNKLVVLLQYIQTIINIFHSSIKKTKPNLPLSFYLPMLSDNYSCSYQFTSNSQLWQYNIYCCTYSTYPWL